VSRFAWAQAYPSRPITIVVPGGSRSSGDVIVRIIAERMRGSLGQPVIIDNVPGSLTSSPARLAAVYGVDPDGNTQRWRSARPGPRQVEYVFRQSSPATGSHSTRAC
jgi:hypothetical protein